MSEIKWRFPGNNYTEEKGLDTADMETFKKDPIASLARELCQNSIDAKMENQKSVIVEFELFQIPSDAIPEIGRIRQEITNCQAEWKNHIKISTELGEMYKAINQEIIDCLRISDYNTIGLEGVGTQEKKAFYLLTKGSGVSEKVGTSGGSKGIGKFATFVASQFNTVFYSTLTETGKTGHTGICKLCSASIEGTDEKTNGIGYYGCDDKNNPILTQFELCGHPIRTTSGTDIYIIGFRKDEYWQRQIISKILDSFMASISFGELEVRVDDVIINENTISNVISTEKYISKSLQKSIFSQYCLLHDDDVYHETITIDTYGSADLYVKGYSKENSYLATNSCVLVRHPYMKIKTLPKISNIPCSAMCIIQKNELNKELRELENPQHTDWEIMRIHDTSKRREIKSLIEDLNKQIINIVSEYLISDSSEESDIEGASDYLPSTGDTDFGNSQVKEKMEKVKTTNVKRNKNINDKGYTPDEFSEVFQPDEGTVTEGEGSAKPSGTNNSNGGSAHPTDEEGKPENGDFEILTKVKLSNIKYRFMVVDRTKSEYQLVFVGPLDERHCELELMYVDDSGQKYQVEILHASLNGNTCDVESNQSVIFEMFSSMKHIFRLVTNQTDLFAAEVRLYARR